MAAAKEDFKDELARHKVVGIDTVPFIYHIEENHTYKSLTTALFTDLELGTVKGVTSTITVMEMLVRPKALGDVGAVEDYKLLLTTYPNLKIKEIDVEVAERAADLRSTYRLRPPDALQAAACLVEGADAFVTNDARMKVLREMDVIILMGFLRGRRGPAVSRRHRDREP